MVFKVLAGLILVLGLVVLMCGLLGNTRPLKSSVVATLSTLALFVVMIVFGLICLANDIVPLPDDDGAGGVIITAIIFGFAGTMMPTISFVCHLVYSSAKGRPTISLTLNQRLAALGLALIFILVSAIFCILNITWTF
jgi:hypothetical protein